MKLILLVAMVLLAGTPAIGAATECIQVPGEMFQPVPDIFPDGPPTGARIAGAGRTLGVLFPELPRGHRLVLVQGGKQQSEVWLPAPKERPFPRQPDFHLGDEGNLVALRVVDFLAVYAGGSLTALVDLGSGASVSLGDSLYWTPAPRLTAVAGARPGEPGRLEEDELPALLMRSELDGAGAEVLLRVDPKRLAADDGGFPGYQALYVALRSDRRLWLAGRFSGEIMLAESDGTVRREFDLGLKLRRPEDDPEVRAEREQEINAQIEAIRARGGDATRRTSGRSEVRVYSRSPVLARAFARGRDLVLVMATTDPPPGSVVVVSSATEEAHCFRLPEHLLAERHPALQLAVTDDALWFRDPPGFMLWQEIESLLLPDDNESKPSAITDVVPDSPKESDTTEELSSRTGSAHDS